MQHHNGFEADDIPAMADEAWDEGDEGFEAESMEEADEGAEMAAADEFSAAEDEFEEEDAYAADVSDEAEFGEEEAYEEEDGMEAGEAWEEDAFEEAGEGFEEGLEDEFSLGDIWRAGSAVASGYNRLPPWMRRAPGQIFGMLTHQPRDISQIYGEKTENAGNDLQVLIQQLKQRLGDGFDEMDVFADAMAEFAEAGEDWEGFVPPLGKLAARYVVKKAVPRRLRVVRKQAAKSIGKQTVRAVEKTTRALVKRYGPKAASAVPRIVRRVVKAVVAQRASPKTIPSMIRRTAVRVAQSPAAARKLSKPNRLARTVRAKTGVKPGALPPRRGARVMGYAPSPLRPYRPRRVRTLRLRGPVTIRYRV